MDRVGGPRTFCVRDVFILFLLILSPGEKEQHGGMSVWRERGNKQGEDKPRGRQPRPGEPEPPQRTGPGAAGPSLWDHEEVEARQGDPGVFSI